MTLFASSSILQIVMRGVDVLFSTNGKSAKWAGQCTDAFLKLGVPQRPFAAFWGMDASAAACSALPVIVEPIMHPQLEELLLSQLSKVTPRPYQVWSVELNFKKNYLSSSLFRLAALGPKNPLSLFQILPASSPACHSFILNVFISLSVKCWRRHLSAM